MNKLKQVCQNYFLLGLIILTIQIVSLFRHYPKLPACGKVIHIFKPLNILINCDSAVFMRDGNNPVRVFQGSSPYGDRPLHSSLAWTVQRLLTLIKVPDFHKVVIGNSGVPYNYSLQLYLILEVMNLIILVMATVLIAKIFLFEIETKNWKPIYKFFFLIEAILITSANELTKTFFWTPHSQMFNILLPCLSFYIFYAKKISWNLRQVLVCLLLVIISSFFYPAMILALIPLFIRSTASTQKKIGIFLFGLIPYIFYPTLVNFFGGKYYNQAFTRDREVIWMLDGLKSANVKNYYYSRLVNFFHTFPILVLILILILGLLIINNSNKMHSFQILNFLKIHKGEFFFLCAYLCFVLATGLNARRITLGPIIFLELFLFINLGKLKFERLSRLTLVFFTIFTSICWVFTTGPLF